MLLYSCSLETLLRVIQVNAVGRLVYTLINKMQNRLSTKYINVFTKHSRMAAIFEERHEGGRIGKQGVWRPS